MVAKEKEYSSESFYYYIDRCTPEDKFHYQEYEEIVRQKEN